MAGSLVYRNRLSELDRGLFRGLLHAPTTTKVQGVRRMSTTSPSQESEQTRRNKRPTLQGRNCLITGGTSGIGYAIAERFLQEGVSRVTLVGRSDRRLETAAAQLRESSTASNANAPQGEIAFHVGDVGKAAEWMRELETLMADVDILVNAAGISHSKILPKTEPEEISRIISTNLEGAILTSRAFMRAAIRGRIRKRSDTHQAPKQHSKCIINISSLLGMKGGTGAVPYAASKAGLLGLTRSLAAEAAASVRDLPIRSNAIIPGYIETPMISDFSDGEVARLKETIPLRRFGSPEEIADAAVFLAQNEYANNCLLNLDGGLSAV